MWVNFLSFFPPLPLLQLWGVKEVALAVSGGWCFAPTPKSKRRENH